MRRAIAWFLPAVIVFGALVLVIAPLELAGRALLLAGAGVVPGVVVLVLAGQAGRNRDRRLDDVRGGRQ